MSTQIIEWSIDGIRLLIADPSGRVSRAVVWETFDHHDTSVSAQEFGDKFKSWLNRQSIQPGQARLVLPRESIVIRQLQLPQAPEEELPDLVKFQSAAKSSVPIDDLALDYLPIETATDVGRSVVTASIDRRRLQRFIQILTAAGFDVSAVTISPLTVGQFVNKFSGNSLGSRPAEIVVFQRDKLIEMSIFVHGSLVFSHTLVLPEMNRLKPFESGLARSIVALHQTYPDVSIEHCYFVGSRDDFEIRELLEKKFPNHVSQVIHPTSLMNQCETAGFESLIGAAFPASSEDLKLDLLHPRKRIEKPDRRKWYWIAGGSAAVLLFIISYGLFLSHKGALEAAIEELNDTIAEVDRKLKAGAPQLDAFQRIESWSLGDANTIVTWNLLRANMPGTDRLYLSELRLLPVNTADVSARFTGVGFARQRNDVDDLYQQLAENGFRVKPQATTTASRDPDYPIRFELDVDVLRPALKSPEAAKTSTSVSTAQVTSNSRS